jgi:hypothetical protein
MSPDFNDLSPVFTMSPDFNDLSPVFNDLSPDFCSSVGPPSGSLELGQEEDEMKNTGSGRVRERQVEN